MSGHGWGQCWSIARRDLHAGFRGLRLLFICLFLGVLTLAAIGSLTAAITGELAARGQALLGGDIEAGISQREATDEEKRILRQTGLISETIRLRAMAQHAGAVDTDTPAAVLTELKGVDRAYPLYGTLRLGKGDYRTELRPDQILIGTALAERLQIVPGDPLRYGDARFTVSDIIVDEPDRVGEGFTLGPVAIVSMEGLRRTGLIQPGSLYQAKYRIRMADRLDTGNIREALEKRLQAAGWELKDRDRAAPGASRFFERMGQFLSLIGLAALVIAGIGVSNGVSSYMTLKRNGIATLRVLGATSRDIERIYLIQIAAVAALAIGCGLVAGVLIPPALVAAAGDILPVRPEFQIHPLPLATSTAYGLIIALIFAWPPLARAHTLPAAAIFRSQVEQRGVGRQGWLMVSAATAVLLALALITAPDPWFAAVVLGSVAGVLLLLLMLGWAIGRMAKRLPRPRNPLWRLAITNLHRPGAQTAALVVALGLALTLFVTLAGIQTSLSAEIVRVVPEKAPNQFVLDIPAAEERRFRTIVTDIAPMAELNLVPALRGTIVAFGGQRVADLKELPEGAWFLRGDRGVTYSASLPEGSDLVAGRWWSSNYAGPPLISLDEEAAKILKIGVGDSMTVSVLGREIEARIASLRKINWDTMGFNYVLVFSPSTLRNAPHTLAATITMDPRHEAQVTRALLSGFSGASVVDIDEVIGQVSDILRQMSNAILAAASVAILAGISVLIGAIAASRQARTYDSVILKTLGATRRQILGVQALEYGLLAAVLGLISLALGGFAAWYVIVELFDFDWAPDWGIVLATLGGGALLTLGIGLLGSLPLISVRPARALRQL